MLKLYKELEYKPYNGQNIVVGDVLKLKNSGSYYLVGHVNPLLGVSNDCVDFGTDYLEMFGT